ncbi:LYR family of Fe/S cluster biogenesis protein [Tanacetum coccineum]
MAYGSTPDAFDEYLQMSEHTARDALFFFNMYIIELYMPKYLRKPTLEDVASRKCYGKLSKCFSVFSKTWEDLCNNGPGYSSKFLYSLDDNMTFILRARVLKLYRQALRVAKRAPPPSKGELMQTIRQEMENNRDCNDRQRIRYLISEGMERLKNLDEMLDMQGH